MSNTKSMLTVMAIPQVRRHFFMATSHQAIENAIFSALVLQRLSLIKFTLKVQLLVKVMMMKKKSRRKKKKRICCLKEVIFVNNSTSMCVAVVKFDIMIAIIVIMIVVIIIVVIIIIIIIIIITIVIIAIVAIGIIILGSILKTS
jgi:type IV secretory pathway VirB6-like protein